MKAEQAVLIEVGLSDSAFGCNEERSALNALADRLASAVEKFGTGEFDGDEVGQGKVRLFFYGPDADSLCETIIPGLRELQWPGAVTITRRYGEPGAPESRMHLE